MTVFVTIDNKNIKDVIDFYYNTTMDILKTGKLHSKLIAEIPEISKDIYAYVVQEISSMKGKKVPVDYSLRISHHSTKFVKIAQGPATGVEIAALMEMLEGLEASEGSGLLETFKSVFGKFDILKAIFEQGKKIAKGALKEVQDIQLLKDLLLLGTSIDVAKNKPKFTPSTYEFLLEGKGPRGINDTYVSKGAYDLPSKKMYEDYERSKRENPELFEKRFEYQDAPEFEPFRKKPTIFFDDTKTPGKKPEPNMKFQPTFTKDKSQEASSNRNIKVAQNQTPLITDEQFNKVKELYPNWNINDLSNEIRQVSASTFLDDEKKQEQYTLIIAKYAKTIEPLHKYLQGMTKEK